MGGNNGQVRRKRDDYLGIKCRTTPVRPVRELILRAQDRSLSSSGAGGRCCLSAGGGMTSALEMIELVWLSS